MSPDPLARIAAMMNMTLYAILSEPKTHPADLLPHLNSHLDYMIELERSGALFASGPLAEPDGEMAGRGLTILRAGSIEQANEIASRDPFFVAGLRTFEVHRWTINEGMMRFEITLSNRAAKAD